MLANYDQCETRVLNHEGSEYTDGVHPYDPGGPTRWGITLTDARLHWKKNATADDVRTMPVSVAKSIYRAKYWDACDCSNLPAGVDDCVFDYGVLSGIGRAGRVLRQLVGMPTSTWVINEAVIDAVARRNSGALINAICDERMRFMRSLSIWSTYGHGWTKRVSEVRTFDLKLAANMAPTQPTSPSAGKGAHTPPPTGKIAAGSGAVVVAGATLWQFLYEHPFESAAAVAVAGALVGLGVYSLERWHTMRQETPMPGTPVVPIAPASPPTSGPAAPVSPPPAPPAAH